ncbi:MAG TPA: polyprenyl synthetase family protein [Candidatus Barnesiella excrementigallinarum]|nr:polyprenyl synthetase family protein [Candidatus Barnesiella excrementigallinarum]
MESLQKYFDTIESALADIEYAASPDGLYAPVRYELSLGGKRVRPLLTLLACEMFGGDCRSALHAAVGLEVFHNFTLLHDDVMDKADVRRGKPTVHKVWDENRAILSGDAMEIIAFRYIARTPAPHTGAVIDWFLKTALEICEGQQYDMEFETRDDVTEAEYIEMIRLKTAVLLGGALKIGAIIGGADSADADRIYRFGESLGLAFQLQDDWLDVYGDPARFGKKIGGDILNNKKTYMLINAQRRAEGADAEELSHWLSATGYDPAEKIAAVTALYNRVGAGELCLQQVDAYSRRAIEALREIALPETAKQPLYDLATSLIKRDH